MGASKVVPLVAGLLWAAPALAWEAVDPSGVWLREDGKARVEIAPCGTDLCATNLWIGDTSGSEEVGDRLVISPQPRSATTLTGKAYDPKRDRTYSITIEVGRDSLTTRGCVLVILCRNVAWTLVE